MAVQGCSPSSSSTHTDGGASGSIQQSTGQSDAPVDQGGADAATEGSTGTKTDGSTGGNTGGGSDNDGFETSDQPVPVSGTFLTDDNAALVCDKSQVGGNVHSVCHMRAKDAAGTLQVPDGLAKGFSLAWRKPQYVTGQGTSDCSVAASKLDQTCDLKSETASATIEVGADLTPEAKPLKSYKTYIVIARCELSELNADLVDLAPKSVQFKPVAGKFPATDLPSLMLSSAYRDPTNGKVYFATPNGLAVSADDGVTFSTLGHAQGLLSETILDVYAKQDLVVASTSEGLAISFDGGATFSGRSRANGLPNDCTSTVGAMGNRLYVDTQWGPAYSDDSGTSFHCIKLNGQCLDHAIGYTFAGDRVYFLDVDQLYQSSPSEDEIHPIGAMSQSLMYANGETILAFDGDQNLVRSTNHGQSFSLLMSADDMPWASSPSYTLTDSHIYAVNYAGIWRMNLDATGVTQISTNGASLCKYLWTDETKLVGQCNRGKVVTSSDGGATLNFKSSARNITFHPIWYGTATGGKIYVTGDEFAEFDPGTEQFSNITHVSGEVVPVASTPGLVYAAGYDFMSTSDGGRNFASSSYTGMYASINDYGFGYYGMCAKGDAIVGRWLSKVFVSFDRGLTFAEVPLTLNTWPEFDFTCSHDAVAIRQDDLVTTYQLTSDALVPKHTFHVPPASIAPAFEWAISPSGQVVYQSGSGLLITDQDAGQFKLFSDVLDHVKSDGEVILHLALTDDHLFVSADAGLYVSRLDHPRFRLFTSANGLPSSDSYHLIVEDGYVISGGIEQALYAPLADVLSGM